MHLCCESYRRSLMLSHGIQKSFPRIYLKLSNSAELDMILIRLEKLEPWIFLATSLIYNWNDFRFVIMLFQTNLDLELLKLERDGADVTHGHYLSKCWRRTCAHKFTFQHGITHTLTLYSNCLRKVKGLLPCNSSLPTFRKCCENRQSCERDSQSHCVSRTCPFRLIFTGQRLLMCHSNKMVFVWSFKLYFCIDYCSM